MIPGQTPPPVIAEILDEQRRRWGQGERVFVETYLPRLPALSTDPGVLLDLIYHEIVLREKAGERPHLEEYAQRFPHLSAELALQFEVDRGLDWQAVTDAAAPPEPATAQAPDETPTGTPYPPLPGYSLTGVLGRGTTGVVYAARQLQPDRSVAVKVVLAGMPAQADALVQLRAEAAKIAALRHRHLCPIYEIGVDAGRLFIVQERVAGSLTRRLADGSVTPGEAAAWLETLARTLHDLHQQGIVHGNLTPANVLLSYSGILKITDIGLARFVDLIPREGRSPGAISPADDVQGLGAILLALLSGKSGIESTLRSANLQSEVCNLQSRQAPRDLETICLSCLATEPDKRYQSAAALAEDLSAFLAGKPIRARRAGLGELGGLGGRLARSIRAWTTGWFTAHTRRMLHEATEQRLRAERSARRLQLMLELTRRLLRITQPDELLQYLAEIACWLAGAELATIYLVDSARRELVVKVMRGAEVAEIRQPLGVDIPGTVATTGQPVNRTDQRLRAVPLLGDGGVVLGVLQVINPRDGGFDVEDQEALASLAAAAAIAFERAVRA